MPRQPVHARQGRVSGEGQLNQKAIKVLAAVKFAPSSVSREDIIESAQATGLTASDVEHQIELLLRLHFVYPNSRFPAFPQQGWRVYTKQEDHQRITALLASHGLEDPESAATRADLGGYYPTGMALEGYGRQPSHGLINYPGRPPIIPELEYRPETMAFMEQVKTVILPFRPKEYSPAAVEEKKEKWKKIVHGLAEIYHIPQPTVTFGVFSADSWNRPGASYEDDNGESSHYAPSTNTLWFTGKFSVITLLHEFGHARGFDERDTTIWSVNLFKRVWPASFGRTERVEGSHVIIAPNRNRGFEL